LDVPLVPILRIVIGILLAMIALVLMNVSTNDYRTVFAIATGFGVSGIVALGRPVRTSKGVVLWIARVSLGFVAILVLYGAVALVSMLVSGE
jgi:hypothetical protein